MAPARLLILIHNQFFEDWPLLPTECKTPCQFTTDPAAAEEADAIVVHVPTLTSMAGLKKRPHQLLVAWSGESPVMRPALGNPTFMHQFDLTVTYQRSSDVWCPYFGPDQVAGICDAPKEKTAPSPVVFLQSNGHDASGRKGYVSELMKVVGVDSYGSVLRNQSVVIPPGEAARLALYGTYKLTLAFENSIADDYVTEKFFDPLQAGSVPVYRGAPQASELAPGPGCFINADHFDSPRDLGDYLNYVAHDDDEYLKYQAWRSEGLSPTFLAHLDRLKDDAFCRLAEAVATQRSIHTP